MSTRVPFARVVVILLSGILVLGTFVLFATQARADDDPTITVFLVRHAEKARGPDAGGDPPLTEAGHARARALAHTLADAGIDVIYTTDRRRTRDTATPTAERLGIEPVEIPIRGEGDLIERMKQKVLGHEGRTVLVVGHSDTTPELAHALGAANAPEIPDDEFHHLYQLIVTPTGRHSVHPRFVHLRYGHPTP